CAGLGYGVIKLQNKRRREIKLKKENSGKNFDKLYVKEWLHQNHKRCVKVKIGPDECITTINRKGEILRKLEFKSVTSLVIEITRDTQNL
ncbi:hypothetical protein CDAR_8051, partial [Caerostris darwini]